MSVRNALLGWLGRDVRRGPKPIHIIQVSTLIQWGVPFRLITGESEIPRDFVMADSMAIRQSALSDSGDYKKAVEETDARFSLIEKNYMIGSGRKGERNCYNVNNDVIVVCDMDCNYWLLKYTARALDILERAGYKLKKNMRVPFSNHGYIWVKETNRAQEYYLDTIHNNDEKKIIDRITDFQTNK